MRTKTWAGLGLAGVLMVGASVKADEPSRTYPNRSYTDVATYTEQNRPVSDTGPTPHGRQAYIFESHNGQLRLKPQGSEALPDAASIHVPPQGVTIEAGPKNTVIIREDVGDGDIHRVSALRVRLILPDNPGQTETAKAESKPTRTFPNAYRVVEADSDRFPATVTRVEGSVDEVQQIKRRLTEVEQKLEMILKELKDLKGR